MSTIKDKIEFILPPVEKCVMNDEAEYYGMAAIIAQKSGLLVHRKSLSGWKHGWLYAALKYPEQISGDRSYKHYLVAKEEHAHFMREHGISATAVGMPFVYVEEVETLSVDRIPGSLLVMPPHSLPYTSHEWDEEKYAEEISKLKEDFNHIVVCLHYSCVTNNLWIRAFQNHDIPWILGADSRDCNSLLRMSRIFRSFEYMTTNSIGSHVVYAAYSGCKVSIYGHYLEYTKKDFENDSAYRRLPFLLEHNLFYSTREYVKRQYPFLFCHPIDAENLRNWAGQELGVENKVSFEVLTNLLKWTFFNQMYYRIISAPRVFFAKMVKKLFRMIKI